MATRAPNRDYIQTAPRSNACLLLSCYECIAEEVRKKELYMAEMQTRSRNTTEDWAVFGKELKRLADKAYPDLQEETHECLALNQYPQLAFSEQA